MAQVNAARTASANARWCAAQRVAVRAGAAGRRTAYAPTESKSARSAPKPPRSGGEPARAREVTDCCTWAAPGFVTEQESPRRSTSRAIAGRAGRRLAARASRCRSPRSPRSRGGRRAAIPAAPGRRPPFASAATREPVTAADRPGSLSARRRSTWPKGRPAGGQRHAYRTRRRSTAWRRQRRVGAGASLGAAAVESNCACGSSAKRYGGAGCFLDRSRRKSADPRGESALHEGYSFPYATGGSASDHPRSRSARRAHPVPVTWWSDQKGGAHPAQAAPAAGREPPDGGDREKWSCARAVEEILASPGPGQLESRWGGGRLHLGDFIEDAEAVVPARPATCLLRASRSPRCSTRDERERKVVEALEWWTASGARWRRRNDFGGPRASQIGPRRCPSCASQPAASSAAIPR